MCNKVNYVSRKDARSAARWMERKRKVQSQHAYQCQRCGFWHLTTMSRERAKADVRARRERRRAATTPAPSVATVPAHATTAAFPQATTGEESCRVSYTTAADE